ncbi:histone acetyltransferase of the CBP family 12 [Actinidia rufa]|uniref:histone acetyltransferase n=1 Tax=Actinidia rufa TaxID=165716 RepID=A0A7J0GLB7_9ERIC|nr:histone acetyltransferase of the CBP family 12 [Actinidia rufa]
MSNPSQRYAQPISSSSPIATMIPTPGMPHSGNSSMIGTSSVDAPVVAASGGNSILPATGFLSTSNGSSVGIHVGCFNSPEGSTIVSQPLTQNQHVGGQNSRILHNLGSHIGGGKQKSYGFSNGALNGGLGIIQNNVQLMNGPAASEGYLTATSYGDGYGISTPDSSGSGNFYAPVNSAGPAMNNQNLNPANLQSLSRTNPPMMSNQSNLHTIQQASLIKSQSIDQSEKMNFQASTSLQENLLQSHHQPLQLQQKLVQHQHHPNQKIQRHQILLKNDSFDHSQLTSDLGGQLKPEHGMECHDEALHSQVSEQFQQSPAENRTQLLSPPSVPQDLCSSVTQTSQQMQQLLLPHQLDIDSQNEFSCLVGVQSEKLLPGQWHLKSQEQSQMLVNLSQEQNIHLEFRQRLTGQDEAQCNNLSSEGSVCHTVVTNTAQPPASGGATCRSANPNREWQFKYQQRWLLFLRHARRCMAPEGKCPEVNCINAQKLWIHILQCNITQCPFPRCHHTKILLNHHKHCRDTDCPVCVPVEHYIQKQLKARTRSDSTSDLPCSINGSCKLVDTGVIATRLTSKMNPPVVKTSEDLQPLLKRIKIERPSQPRVLESESSAVSVPTGGEPHVLIDAPRVDYQHGDTYMPMKAKVAEVKMECPLRSGQGCPDNSDIKEDNLEDNYSKRPVMKTIISDDPAGSAQLECMKSDKDMDRAKQENMTLPAESVAGTKSGKPKIKGVSMTELFTPEQVREHIIGLRRWVGQSKSKAEKNQAMEHSMSENSCQLCAVEKLTFEPPPIYCTPCGARIKRNSMYYTIGAGDTRHYFCIPCYNEARGETILVDGTAVPKARLEKKKNDEETEEWWVQCDKCEAWQHQICALFNGRRNDGGQAEYTCPKCYIVEIERGEREPLPQSAVLGAKDLPRTILSDHIEQRLFRRLKQERQERARLQGKSYDEVPGAEALVLRVVSSVDKKLEVKQRFLEIFQEENYPIEYPYKSKIGYLEYCKKRGFTSCYIWACPPLKGEDYILYCHPEIQKTPKSDKLREWYLSMLRKAAKENVVVDLTNLYDHFFVSTGECKAKVTAARLPYFDGDYWPGAAEDMIYQIRQEEDNRKQHKKGTTKKTITKRALKLSGQSDLSGNASKDLLLMHKLGETICPMKEDFIMVHLQHACTHCCVLMVSGNRWACNQCKKFQLCDKCYETEQKLEEGDRHPINQRDKHILYPVEINDVPEDTKDKDEILESEFFDTRQAFLSLCQGNHYQYDTLRRAKHSSMMVLYHLHNPTAPAFVTTCNMCHLDIEAGQGWRCEICPDYDVCNSCHQKDGGIDHPHQLTNHPSLADRDAQNQEARELRVLQLRKMLDLLVHASQCRSPHCQYPHCRKVKSLFRHGIQCKTRASGGCALCKKMWYLLQLHARACKESQCHVPRCRDLKEHLRRLQQQSDSRRRAAVMEMMRQRAAEVAGNAE